MNKLGKFWKNVKRNYVVHKGEMSFKRTTLPQFASACRRRA